MNKGWSKTVKKAFLQVEALVRPTPNIVDTIPSPWWISGFSCAEASFSIIGSNLNPHFRITQLNRDEKLLNLIVAWFGCGQIFKHSEGQSLFQVSSTEKALIMYYLILILSHHLTGGGADRLGGGGQKTINYQIWREFVLLKQSKEHLIPEGNKRALYLKSSINK